MRRTRSGRPARVVEPSPAPGPRGPALLAGADSCSATSPRWRWPREASMPEVTGWRFGYGAAAVPLVGGGLAWLAAVAAMARRLAARAAARSRGGSAACSPSGCSSRCSRCRSCSRSRQRFVPGLDGHARADAGLSLTSRSRWCSSPRAGSIAFSGDGGDGAAGSCVRGRLWCSWPRAARRHGVALVAESRSRSRHLPSHRRGP